MGDLAQRLTEVIRTGTSAELEQLLAHGADPTWTGHGGLTAAEAAEREGAQELAAWLRRRA